MARKSSLMLIPDSRRFPVTELHEACSKASSSSSSRSIGPARAISRSVEAQPMPRQANHCIGMLRTMHAGESLGSCSAA